MLDLRDAIDPAVVGGKAAGLGVLVRDGFTVPPGVVVTPEDEVDPDALWQQLDTHTLAVRSSGVGEDGAAVSLAGAFDTVLGVEGPDALGAAIVEVRRSAAGARARAAGVEDSPIPVLVQRQVDAVASGVAFTADPVTGSRRVVVIGAVRGVGATLVDGTEEGDEWRAVEGRVVPVRRRGDVIDAERAAEIAALARRVEDVRGRPQDMEWAWDGTDLWVLQARPMTGLPDEPRARRWRRRG